MASGQIGRFGGAVLHGHAIGIRTKEFQAWLGMRLRCKQNAHYIKHGVQVCAAWAASFSQFLSDVGQAPSPQHTLDRWPDPAGNYKPGNVRWATMLEQRANRRPGSKVGRPWLGEKRPALAGTLNPSAKLSAEAVDDIRRRGAGGESSQSIGLVYGVCRQSVRNILSGRTHAS